MTKRLQQQPPKKAPAERKGCHVFLADGAALEFKEARGWNFFGEILQIGGGLVPIKEEVQLQDGSKILRDKEVNETLASIRNWSHVMWSGLVK